METIAGSFRDPLSRVLSSGDEIVRVFTEKGAEDLDQVLPFIEELAAAGLLIDSEPIETPPAPYAQALRHPRLELITHPYEWTFSMLQDAAMLQLDITARGLVKGIGVKDATPYNIQFVGSKPLFIDAGSFEPRQQTDPWFGYQQFCEMFLYPLMLKAYVGVDFQPLLRGSVHGIPVAQARRLLGNIRLKRQKGLLAHVILHELAQRKFADDSTSVVGETKAAGMSTEVVEATVRKLMGLVGSLSHPAGGSTWSDYSDRAHYKDESLRQKHDFVQGVLDERERWGQVWDFGCNDGLFSDRAAAVSDLVVAVDADELVIDRLYHRLKQRGPENITPLLIDLSEAGGSIGWRGMEREGIFDRASVDLALYLAVIHHMAITFNVPLGEQVDLLADLTEQLVIEFPHQDDPMVQTLLRNKRPGLYDHYNRSAFEDELNRRFNVERTEVIDGGTRTLYYARRK